MMEVKWLWHYLNISDMLFPISLAAENTRINVITTDLIGLFLLTVAFISTSGLPMSFKTGSNAS